MKVIRIVLLVTSVALFAASCGQGNVFELEVGACFNELGQGEVSDVPMKECSDPHDNEVYAVFDVSDSTLPPSDSMLEGCFDRFEEAIGEPYQTSIYDFGGLTPSAESWDQGDREVICYGFIVGGSEKMTASIIGSGE